MKLVDLDEVYKIEEENFEDPWPIEIFKQDIDNPVSDMLVLKKDGKVIGYLNVIYTYEDADLCNIALSEEHQGKGYGNLLIEELIQRCKDRKIKNIHLEVNVLNEKAINLYKKYGFKEIRKRKGYYNGVDGIDMMKGVESEEDISY